MKTILCFIVLTASVVLSDMSGECDLASFYLELGCTPLFAPNNSTVCPEAFTCPDLHPDPSMCYYRGKQYADRAMIPQDQVANPCSQACSCRVTTGPQFECAAVDCVETFDPDAKQCVDKYELDSCCSVGNVCGKDAIAKLATCEVDGQRYREGEQFEPKNTRKTCICTSQWDGNVDNQEYCRDINCGIEIHYQNNLLENCAPIFVKNMKGCPIAFQCSSNSTKVIQGLNLRTVSSKCVFGNTTMSVGDEVIVDEKCTKCSCEVPPFVSCTKQYSCD